MQLHAFSLLLAALTPHADATPIPDFALRDHRGQLHRLADWRDRKVIVVVFLGTGCPLAKLYAPQLVQLEKQFKDRGVAFVGIDANQQDSLTALGRFARTHHLPFPLLKDVGNVVADRFGAERTPEVFILDERRVVRYRGRIDDQYAVGIRKAKPQRRDLTLAVQDLLACRPVAVPRTEVPGCRIGRVAAGTKGALTYYRDVAPIVQKRCLTCHRPGQVAPLPLTSYRDVSGWAPTIRDVVSEGRMPPWSANPKHGRFANDPSLSAREKQTLLDWIDQDCPEGDPADLPPARVFAEGWNIPTPDLVVSMAQPFTVPAEGVVEYQYFEVDPGFTEDRWIQAAEIRPGNRPVVHHCNVFLKPPQGEGLAELGSLGSYCLAAAAQGTPPLVLPEGMAKRVPAGWHFVFVVHYTTVGSVQTDRTSIGLKFADPRTVKKEVATKLMYDPGLCIPPGVADHTVAQTWQVNEDVLLLAFFPHMHLRGKSFRYEALYPDGTREILLDVPRFDFAWQHRYELAEPRRLPAGSRLRCTAVYDNSSANLANPDPKATVRAGTQSWEEMFNGYFEVVRADEDLTQESAPSAVFRRGVRKLFRPGFAVVFGVLCGLFLVRRRVRARVVAREAASGGPVGSA